MTTTISSQPTNEISTKIRPSCLTPFEYWEPPTTQEIRTVIKMANLTGAQVAKLVGICNSRTIRKWTGGDAPIPYAAWAILCHKAGLGIIWI